MSRVVVDDQRRPVRWSKVVPAIAFMLITVSVCGALGWWQWQRAQQNATTVTLDPPVPIAEVMSPGTSPGAAIGRQVTVTGEWADSEAAVIWGREVDDEPAVFLVRPLTVSAQQTGTGEPATLAVLVGWRDADTVLGPDAQTGTVTFDGYVRAAEAQSFTAQVPDIHVEGAFSTGALATSEFAQRWNNPMYAAVVVSYEGSPSWQVLPPREPESRLDFRSLAYAIEWWLFGAFFVFIAARWIRDNGRDPVPDAEDAPQEEAPVKEMS